MADRTVRVRLEAIVSGFESAMERAAGKADTVAKRAKKAGDDVDAALGDKRSFGKNLGDSLERASGSLDKMGNLAGGLGLAIAAPFGLAIKSFADFDKQMSSVSATGDDARANLAALREAAISAGADTAFSAKEAAEGMEEMLKAGVSAKDVMGGGLKGALDLAAAGQIDVGEAAETAATAMTQFKLSGKDVPHIADLLAAGAGKAQGEVGDMAYALKQGGLVAAQFGLSVEDTTGTLAAFASAGLIGSDAGTSFKTMLLSLANPSVKAAQTMRQLGINAYDAQGNFVGVTALAGQLQTQLGGLSQEQRNAALATIFGTDAIRAASIMYDQGSSGIQKWIDDTNDAGYAAEVAAEKQNNLAGDIEKLGGSIDSVFLKSASGANSVLRQMAQAVEGLVDGIGKVPAPMLQTMLALTGVAGAGLIGAGGVLKIASAAGDAIGTFRQLRAESPRLASGLKGVGKASAAMAATGAGVALGAAALQYMSIEGNKARTSVEDFVGALKSTGSAVNGLGDIDSKFKFDNGVEQINGVNDALSQLAGKGNGASQQIEQFQMSVGLAFSGSNLTKATNTLTELDGAMAQLAQNGSADQVAASFAKISDQAARDQVPLDKLIGYFPKYADQVRELAKSVHYDIQSPQELADIMAGRMPPAMAKAVASSKNLTDEQKSLASATGQSAESLSDQVEKLSDFANTALDASGSAIAFEKSIDDANDALNENGKTLDITTEKGRANREALDSMASAGLKNTQAMAANGAQQGELQKTLQRTRDRFVETAQKMGMNKRDAEQLADSYGLIPGNVKTNVSAPGATGSKRDADALNNALRAIPKNKRAEVQSEFDRGGVDAAYAALNKVNGKVAKTYIDTYRTTIVRTIEGGAAVKVGNRRVGAYATGGPVYGPGSATSDSILAKLSNGEFVVRAAAVNMIGLDRLQHMNTTGQIPAFASGGAVDQIRFEGSRPSMSPRLQYAPAASNTSTMYQDNKIILSQTDPNAAAIAVNQTLGRLR